MLPESMEDGFGLGLHRQMSHRRLIAVVVVLTLLCTAACLLRCHSSPLGAEESSDPLRGMGEEEAWAKPLDSSDDVDTLPEGLLRLSCLLQQCLPSGTRALRVERAMMEATLEAMGVGVQTDHAITVAGSSWNSIGARVLLGLHKGALLRRAVLLFPSAPPQLVSVRHIEPLQTVHIIVGLRNRRSQLRRFLQGILAQLLPRDPNFALHIAYSSSEVDTEVPVTDHGLNQSSQPVLFFEDHQTQVTEEGHQDAPFKQSKSYSGAKLLHQTKQMVQDMLEHVPQLKWTWQVPRSCSGKESGFSRGCVINSAARSLQPGDLLLLADVDMNIDTEALRRCRANTRQGRQVYFPIAFSLFNPNGPYNSRENTGKKDSGLNAKLLATPQNIWKIPFDNDKYDSIESVSATFSRLEAPSTTKHIVNTNKTITPDEQDTTPSKKHSYQKRSSRSVGKLYQSLGFWRVFGFGMVCLYQEDLVRVGGLPETEGWGGEDLHFFRQLAKLKEMEVVRGPEPGLVHDYHPKDCGELSGAPGEESAGVSPAMLPHCLKSKALAEGSQEALAATLLDIELLH